MLFSPGAGGGCATWPGLPARTALFRQWLAVALIIAASAGSTLTSRRRAPLVGGESREGWQGG
jgi:hypothetical protein